MLKNVFVSNNNEDDIDSLANITPIEFDMNNKIFAQELSTYLSNKLDILLTI